MKQRRELIDRLALFFYAIIFLKGDEDMFSDELLEKILTDDDVIKCPIGTQATIIRAIERILEDEEKENKDATIRES